MLWQAADIAATTLLALCTLLMQSDAQQPQPAEALAPVLVEGGQPFEYQLQTETLLSTFSGASCHCTSV